MYDFDHKSNLIIVKNNYYLKSLTEIVVYQKLIYMAEYQMLGLSLSKVIHA